jgi:hypothetical protein
MDSMFGELHLEIMWLTELLTGLVTSSSCTKEKSDSLSFPFSIPTLPASPNQLTAINPLISQHLLDTCW